MLVIRFPLICEACGAPGARKVGAMTAYHWDGKGEDPNRPLWLCEECADEYVSYWQDRWHDYYESVI